MANTKTLSINIHCEEETKNAFSSLCAELGLSVSTAINIFMKNAVRNNAIPVSLSLDTKPASIDDLSDEEFVAMLDKCEEEIESGNCVSHEQFLKHLKDWDKKYGV